MTPAPKGHSGIVLPVLGHARTPSQNFAAQQQNLFKQSTIDPYAQDHDEINEQFIAPRTKFGTIFEEYIDKQKQFDHLRSQHIEKDEGTQQNEIDTLKTKLETIKKIQAVELRHAKQTAANEANAMLKDKLGKCKLAYENEFEGICL